MILVYDARPVMTCRAFLFPIEALKPYVAVHDNCLVLIVLLLVASIQQWCGLAGNHGRQKKADIYNIYGGKDLIPVCDPFMVGSGHARV